MLKKLKFKVAKLVENSSKFRVGDFHPTKTEPVGLVAAGEASKCRELTAGDRVAHIAGLPVDGMNHVDAWKLLKSRPNGPVTFGIHKLTGPK